MRHDEAGALRTSGGTDVFKIKGEQLKVANLLKLLSKAASAELSVFAETVSFESGSSDRLRTCLRQMVDDERKSAQVDVNYTSPFGIFGQWQKLNVPDVLGIEEGAPGMGTAIAIHEIWENYAARNNDDELRQYGPAHAAALEVEGVIAAQLTDRQGSRVASVAVGDGANRGFILDYEDYFLVLKSKPANQWANGRFTAEFADREEKSSTEIDGITAGLRVAQELVEDVVQELKEKPRATAQLTGLRLENEGEEIARQRAQAVRSAIIVALDEDDYAYDQGIELDEVRSKGQGADLGARRPWASPQTEVTDNTKVRVQIFEPSS